MFLPSHWLRLRNTGWESKFIEFGSDPGFFCSIVKEKLKKFERKAIFSKKYKYM